MRFSWTVFDGIFNGERLIGSTWKGSMDSQNWGYSLDANDITEVIECGFNSMQEAEDAARQDWRERQEELAVSVYEDGPNE